MLFLSLYINFFLLAKLQLLIKKVKQLVTEFPESEYTKSLYRRLRKKFWLGSGSVKYYDLFSEAWSKILHEDTEDIIKINDLKFIKDSSLYLMYTDIFISGSSLKPTNISNDEYVAMNLLALLHSEGPYENTHVKIEEGDIILDVGANIGVFSLFCINKKPKRIYAFEPQKSVIGILEKNLSLNNVCDLIEIIPLGLSDKTDRYRLYYSNMGHVASSIAMERNFSNEYEEISCIELDTWVRNNNIQRIDFIKADIEGAERRMLRGATFVLRNFQPKLAICTYHYHDDHKVLEEIILKANPNYIIYKTSHKLFAYVPNSKFNSL